MSNVPLPEPLAAALCVPAHVAFTADQMHAYAAAVTAAKDAEIERLRKVLWKIVYLRPDIEHPPLHSEAEGIRILARAALGDKTPNLSLSAQKSDNSITDTKRRK